MGNLQRMSDKQEEAALIYCMAWIQPCLNSKPQSPCSTASAFPTRKLVSPAPSVASGIRIGTPGITTRGMKEDEVRQIGELISKVLLNYDNEALLETCKKEVNDLCVRFPIYTNLL